MGRRTLVLVVLLCLIAASAFAAHKIFSSAKRVNPTIVAQGPLVTIAYGNTGSESWSLRVYERGGQLCRLLVAAGVESSRCAPAPAPPVLGVSALASPDHRFIFGVTGDAVRQIAVGTRDKVLTATYPLEGRRVRAAGVPVAARYFVLALDQSRRSTERPLEVQALDARHHPTGRPRLICVQGPEPSTCD
jgi:hypothetical protein